MSKDVRYLARNQEGAWEPRPFLQTPAREREAVLSPNGRYLAYVSNETGRDEVYVRPFPEGGRKVTVSNNGGSRSRWTGDGKQLFYVQGEVRSKRTLMAVAVSTEGEFSAGTPERLFENPSLGLWGYDVSADGRLFIVPETVPSEETSESEASQPSIHVVQNWYEEFRDRERARPASRPGGPSWLASQSTNPPSRTHSPSEWTSRAARR